MGVPNANHGTRDDESKAVFHCLYTRLSARFVWQKNEQIEAAFRHLEKQNIHVDKNTFNINTNLSQPQKNILSYNKSVVITPSTDDSLTTHVEIKSELKVKKLIPFFFRNLMNKKVEETNKKDIDAFMEKLEALEFKEESGLIVEFWGGEPLVYIKTLRPLAEALRQRYQAASFGIVTNGSLLNPEIKKITANKPEIML